METKKRKILLCDFCRKRKIKCDKQFPCSSCKKFNKSCTFSNNLTIAADAGASKTSRLSPKFSNWSPVQDQKRKPDNFSSGTPTNRSNSPVSEPISVPQNSTFNYNDNGINSGSTSEYTNPSKDVLFTKLSILSEKLDSLETTLKQDPFIPDYDESDSDDEFNPFEFQEGVYENEPLNTKGYGSFGCIGTIKIDPILSSIWNNKRLDFVHKYTYGTLSDDAPLILREMFNQETSISFDDKTIRYFNSRCYQEASAQDCGEFRNNYLQKFKQINPDQMNNLSDPKNSSLKANFLDQVISILPKRRLLWILVQHFCNKMYPGFPVVDEWDFTEKLIRLLGSDNKDMIPVTELHINEKLDFTTLGILLIMLRLSQFSIYLNDMEFTTINNNFDINTDINDHNPGGIFIYNNELPEIYKELNLTFSRLKSIQFFECAHVCLNQFNLFTSLNIPIFQLLLMVCNYHSFGCEFGDFCDEGECQILNRILFQSAYSIGLHNDYNSPDHRLNNLRRHLWFGSCIIDYNTFFVLGESNGISNFEYSTRPAAEHDGVKYNTMNPNVERIAIRLLSHSRPAFKQINEIYLLFNSSKNVRISKLYHFMDRFFMKSDKHFNRLINEVNDPLSMTYNRSYNIKYYLVVSIMSISMSFHFYNYLLKIGKPHKSMKYMCQMINTIYKLVLNLIQESILQKENFRSFLKLNIMPMFMALLQKILMINLSIFLRLKLTPQLDSIKLQKLLLKSNNLFLKLLGALSGTYYCAWKSLKIYYYMINNVNLDQMKPANFGFTVNNIATCQSIIGTALDEFEISQAFNSIDYEKFNFMGVTTDNNGNNDNSYDAQVNTTGYEQQQHQLDPFVNLMNNNSALNDESKTEFMPSFSAFDDYWLMVHCIKRDKSKDYNIQDYFENLISN